LAAGKHVLLQKPMAPTLDEADALVRTARGANLLLGVLYLRRFQPRYHLVKRLLDAGVIGRVTAIREHTGHGGGLRLRPDSWRRSAALAGAWGLLSIHTVDFFRWLIGPAKRVAAIGRTVLSPMAGDDNFSASIEYESGVIATLEACYNMVPAQDLLEVYGDEGTLSLSGDTCRVYSQHRDSLSWSSVLPTLIPESESNGWWRFDLTSPSLAGLSPFPSYFHHWVDCLRRGTDPVTPGEEGIASLEIILAGYHSVAEGHSVTLKRQ
jgi:predicted dehydrogenase